MKTKKHVNYVILGIVFWFIAAMIIRFFGNAVFSANNRYLILFYALGIPITFLFVFITKSVSQLQYHELLKPIVIITLTAALLDGVALTWFRQLYSESYEVAMYGSAWILWGVGLGLLIPYLLEIKSKKRED